MTLFYLSTIISLTFMFLNHPVSMSILILLQTILISMMTGMYLMNFWFSYVIFLVMIGGLLVLFLYMTNTASNEKFSPSWSLTLAPMFMTSILTYWILTDKVNLSYNFNYSSKELFLMIMKFYNFPLNSFIILMMIYLILTLIMTVKMTNLTKGPLRQKN